MEIAVAAIEDARLDDYRNVPDPELLRTRGLFIAEGRHVVRRLLASRFRTRSMLLTHAARDGMDDVVSAAPDIPIFVVSQETMNAITGFNIHRGCLAVGERGEPLDWRDVTRGARVVLALERVANADNVGGTFRNAAALGGDAVLLGAACADPLYRKSIRTSMGAALRVPFAALPAVPALKDAGFTIIALTPAADAIPLREIENAAQLSRAAIFLGHEGDGLLPETLAQADARVRIPMADGVDSLNVATAAALALHELARP